jgi:predicted RNA-binding Zn ribbon-like protein
VLFDSHVLTLVDATARLVNELTPGHRGGRPCAAPAGEDLVNAAARALGGDGRPTPRVTFDDAEALARFASEMRLVFHAVREGDLAAAATTINDQLVRAGARPQLDPQPEGGWQVHFHGSDDTLATGWAAGCATGLALALGSDLAGRMGMCDADRCDRVYVDTSKNGSRRFCSISCQNRTKAAAHRSRK